MRPLCVLGTMANENGLKIAAELRKWLSPVYTVHEVIHDGSAFEYTALKKAQELSIQTREPVLYIHTRGAVNVYPTTIPTRKMWREEFGTQWQKYYALARTEAPRVLCPFVDDGGITRYNGFVANTAAWETIDLRPCADRMRYERLWQGRGCTFGLLIHSEQNDIKKIRKFLQINYG